MLVDPRLVDADLQYNLRERVAPSLVCEWRVHRVCRVADARRRVEGPPLRLFRRIRLPVSCLHATVDRRDEPISQNALDCFGGSAMIADRPLKE